MRITLVTETFAPQVNGVSRTLGQLARAFQGVGDELQVVHPDYREEAVATEGILSIPARSIRLPFYRELYLPIPPFGRVYRAVDAFAPDLIHIATEATLGLAMLRHARRRSIPVVSSFHTNFDQYVLHYGVGFLNAMVWRYLRGFHNATAETYVPSMVTIRALRSRGFERLALWPRGVDSALFRPRRAGRDRVREGMGVRPGEIVIAHVSRIAAEKNVGYLAEALQGVVRSRPRARLLIVGDGPERPALEERLNGAAHFAGYRQGEDLADHYAAADLFAFASKTETFGNVILEAMASGLPVVALRAGGPGDIVREGETGRLVDPQAAPEVFRDVLLSLVDDDGLRQKQAMAAREYALSQSWDAIMSGLRARYEAVVSGHRAG